MPGTALENFTDFMAATGPQFITTSEEFINEAAKRTYILDRHLRGGESDDEILQGGDSINFNIMFDEASTYQTYKPNEPIDWVMPQVVQQGTANWRFSMDQMTWADETIQLNMDSRFSEDALVVQYLSMKKKLEQRMWTSMINGIEDALWAPAITGTYADMEGSEGGTQYSIPSLVVEDTTNYHASNWVNIHGLDPASYSAWRNQVSTYDYDDPEDTDGDRDGLVHAFDEMLSKIKFTPPKFHGEHFEDYNKQVSRQYIACSLAGQNLYKHVLRSSNDTLVSKQDSAYLQPKLGGIDVVYVAALDGSYLEDSGVAKSESTATKDGYRYYFINGNYLKPVFHTSRYFMSHTPRTLPNQPFTYVQPVNTYWNLVVCSRQRQGIVAPAA